MLCTPVIPSLGYIENTTIIIILSDTINTVHYNMLQTPSQPAARRHEYDVFVPFEKLKLCEVTSVYQHAGFPMIRLRGCCRRPIQLLWLSMKQYYFASGNTNCNISQYSPALGLLTIGLHSRMGPDTSKFKT